MHWYIIFSFFTIFFSLLPAELPLVISICSYNNAAWVEANLDSVFMQNYSNFRILYIDDASQDGTADAVQKYINKHNLHDKITLVRRSQRCRKMKNMYLAFHSCKDYEIIVQLDGDDWFAHKHVLSTINKLYQENDIWIAYTQFKFHPSDKIGYSKPVPQNIINKNSFRAWREWVYMGTRSFYAWLFKCVKLEDFISHNVRGYRGKFFPASNDAAIMFPMLEMAHQKIGYIPDITYIYNQTNPLIGNKIDSYIQRTSISEIFARRPYQPLQNPLPSVAQSGVDILILSTTCKNTQKYLYDLLHKIHGFNKIYVIYESGQECTNYKELKKEFPGISVTGLHAKNLADKLQKVSAPYILLLDDKNYITSPIDLQEVAACLNMTHAYGFYLDIVHSNRLISQHIYDTFFAWKFSSNKKRYAIHTASKAIYKKEALTKAASSKKVVSISSFRDKWQRSKFPADGVGLFKDK